MPSFGMAFSGNVGHFYTNDGNPCTWLHVAPSWRIFEKKETLIKPTPNSPTAYPGFRLS